MRICFDCLTSERSIIQNEFHLVAVGETSDVDLFTLASGPVPVGKQVQNRFITLPTFVVVIIVLGKSAQIHHPEVGCGSGPFVEARPAAITKAGPDKCAREPVSFGEKLPPIL